MTHFTKEVTVALAHHNIFIASQIWDAYFLRRFIREFNGKLFGFSWCSKILMPSNIQKQNTDVYIRFTA